MANPLFSGGNSSRKIGESINVRVGDKVLTVVRTGRGYVEDWKDALNSGRGRDDVAWVVDDAGNLRLRDVPVQTPFDQFIERAARRILSPQEIRDASFHWKNIAVERGFLRHQGDHRYELRHEPPPVNNLAQEQAA